MQELPNIVITLLAMITSVPKHTFSLVIPLKKHFFKTWVWRRGILLILTLLGRWGPEDSEFQASQEVLLKNKNLTDLVENDPRENLNFS